MLDRPRAQPPAAEEAVLAARGRTTGLVVTAGAVVVVPAWAAFDYVLEPGLAAAFTVVRLTCVLPMVVGLWLLWTRPVGRRQPGAVTTAVLAVVQLEIGWMLPQVDHLEFYLLGGSLLLYASGAVLATRPVWTMLLSPVIWLGLLLGQLTTSGRLTAVQLTAAAFFLGTATIIGVLSHIVRYRLLRREIRARLDLEREQQRTQELLARLQRLSTEDPLTGLANRRRWDHELAAACARTRRGRDELALVLIDVDHLKAINDRTGHAGGDDVLRQVAQLLAGSVRTGDLVARLGGDEMALLLPGASSQRAVTLAEQIRTAAHGLRPTVDRGHPVTLSLGVTSTRGRAVRPDELTAEADAQLYRAKITRDSVASDAAAACSPR